jgi:hypothetical protein
MISATSSWSTSGVGRLKCPKRIARDSYHQLGTGLPWIFKIAASIV